MAKYKFTDFILNCIGNSGEYVCLLKIQITRLVLME